MADKPETAPDAPAQAERSQTPSGFVIFREAEGTTVWESRLATEGPHARIETDGRVLKDEAGAKPNLLVSIPQARVIIDGLVRFIKAAEGDELTEPAPEPTRKDPAIRKEWTVGTSTDRGASPGEVYILAPDETSTLRTQAVAKSDEIARAIIRDHNGSRIVKDHYLGRECWMGIAPKCPEHGKILDLEWQKDGRIMWYCDTCLGGAKR